MNEYALNEYLMKRKMEDFALKHGYLPYEPRLFESYDDFSSLSCEVKKEQLATVINGQQFQLMRPDITTSIMNDILPNMKNDEQLKLFYQSTIYRALEQKIKAVNQFGIEYLGVIDQECEKEMLDLAISYLEDVPFVLEVTTTEILKNILQICALDAEQEKIIRKLIYIKNREELVKFGEINKLPVEIQQLLPKLFTLRGSYEEVINQLQNFKIKNTLLDPLTKISYLKEFNHPQIIFDLSMTSELTYYEGIIFKGYYPKIPSEVLSGGRYGKNAIGFSIEVDSWLKAQKLRSQEEGSAWHI